MHIASTSSSHVPQRHKPSQNADAYAATGLGHELNKVADCVQAQDRFSALSISNSRGTGPETMLPSTAASRQRQPTDTVQAGSLAPGAAAGHTAGTLDSAAGPVNESAQVQSRSFSPYRFCCMWTCHLKTLPGLRDDISFPSSSSANRQTLHFGKSN